MQKFADAPNTFKKWVWKEETNTLEQINTGLQPLSEKQLLNFSKMKKGYNVTGNKGISNTKTKKPVPPATTKISSPIPSMKVSTTPEEHMITLEDVKNVTFNLMLDDSDFTEHFQACLRNRQFDELLAIMLLYFEAFFKKVSLDEKCELSTTEKKILLTVMQCMEATQKALSRTYCILILGLDTEKQHHMACGKSRKSYTKRDRDFYENLYSYCCFLVWVTFRRKQDFERIQGEIGRLFRSSAFNPHGRPVVEKEFKRAYELKEMDVEDISLNPNATRSQKRPPIKSILDQRSPVLVSLFPNSKECAPWLLDRRTALSVHKKKSESCEEHIVGSVDPQVLNVGIIGENISGFNLNNLTPFGVDAEYEKDGEHVDECET